MKFLEPSCVANRERFLKAAGLGSSRALGLELSHSRRVLLPAPGTEADAASRGFDGLLLRDSSFAATVTVADCMPIWLLDRGSGAFGVLHSGWRGTGILLEALRVLASAGSDPAGIAVVLGPAIGRCCYEVQDERAAAFRGEFGAECVQVRGGLCHLDLRAANVSIAAAAGVGSLLSIEACTSCDHRLGSFRRQGASSFTRMLAAVGAPEAP
jgi:YfiH family protein